MNQISEYDPLWDILRNEKLALADRILAGDTARYLYLKNGESEQANKVAAEIIPLAHTYLAKTPQPNLEIYDALERAYIARAPYDLHSYLIALEWKRPAKDRFYQPRMAILRPVVDTLTDMMVNDEYDIVEVSMPPRVGKLLADDTPILTSEGWKNHGDLVLGDMVVSPQGNFVPVTHVFPKNVADRLVTFTNGEQIQCHANHEWMVYDRSSHKYRVVETGYLEQMKLDSGKPGRGHRYRFQLPPRAPLAGIHRDDLQVDPYTLGVWLGDGTNRAPQICGSPSDVALIASNIPYVQVWHYSQTTTGVDYVSFETRLRKDLQAYGMCQSHRTTEKHIPEAYLTADKNQRLELLAGLLDTDGCLIAKDHRYTFTTSSERLKDDVSALISTFGWRVSCQTKQPVTSSSGIVRKQIHYVLAFNPTEHIPCRLVRKQLHSFSKPRRISFASIEVVDPKPGNCISVQGGYYCAGRQMVPTHNTTLGLLFIGWCIGRDPDSPILATAYAEKITKMFYTEIYGIYEDSDTYNYRKIFPQLRLIDTSAKDLTLDFRDDGGETTRKYKSLTCRPIDGSLTGATEARQLLYCDDLVRDIEEAMSRDRLDALDQKLVADAQSRKKEGCKELHIGTRWSIHDPMSRLAKRHEDDPRCKIIVMPALDPETEESNFDYPYGVGFSTEHYHALRDVYEEKNDLVTWECVYQQNPIEREGLLFPADELTYVLDLPPLDDSNRPDDIFAFCDVAFGGNDFLCMPIAYQWGDDAPLIVDVAFLKGDYKTTEPLVAGKLIQHKVARAIFEANNGGDFYAQDVLEILKEKDYKMFLTSKRADSTKSKETRIMQHSPAIKSFTFLHPKSEHASQMYRQFLNQLTTYTINGKNKNDDAPDALAGLATMQRTNINATVRIFDRSRI